MITALDSIQPVHSNINEVKETFPILRHKPVKYRAIRKYFCYPKMAGRLGRLPMGI